MVSENKQQLCKSFYRSLSETIKHLRLLQFLSDWQPNCPIEASLFCPWHSAPPHMDSWGLAESNWASDCAIKKGVIVQGRP